MKISVEFGEMEAKPAEMGIIGLFEGERPLDGDAGAVDEALGGAISELIGSGEFEGKLNQISVVHTRGAIPLKRVLVIGLGKRDEFDLDRTRLTSSKAVIHIRDMGLKEFLTGLHNLIMFNRSTAAEAVVTGTLMGLYRFTKYKTVESDEAKEVEEFTLMDRGETEIAEVREGARRGRIVAEAVNFARDLSNEGGNNMTPTKMAEKASEMADDYGLKLQVLDRGEVQRLEMGAFLGVAQGSDQPPKFIIIEYKPGEEGLDTIVLVGKSITFDSGGISIKPSEKMEEMRYDKSGGCAVLGVMRAVSELGLPINVVGLLPATENLPSGSALKPGDVLRSSSGKTIEVINTDAEGRLTLSDALTYATRYKPKAIIDLATLTGACVVALGNHASGLLGNDEALKEKIKRAAEASGEKVWELPLWEEYDEQIKSDFADVKNVGGREGGAITAAAFLKKFVEEYPWAHLDIAGTAWTVEERGYFSKGATGVGVRLIVQFLRNWVGE